MFRFSIDTDATHTVNPGQLAEAGITVDEGLPREVGAEEGVSYYRASNADPKTMRDAIEYVQGLFMHHPRRVWIDGEEHEVTDEDVAAVRKPST